jgi:hypothetical protein
MPEVLNPESPERLTRPDQITRWMMLLTPVAFAVLLTFSCILLRRKQRREERLTREGRLLEGQVISCAASHSSETGHSVELRYSFLAPDGRHVEGKRSERRDDLKDAQLPAPGTPVAVLYADEKLHQVL